MTILGISVREDRVVGWTDSEIFVSGEPAGHQPKLQVNVLAGAIMLGTGFSTFLRAATELFLAAQSVDEIAAALPTALRRRAGQVTHRLTTRRRDWLAAEMIVVGGYSAEMQRMVSFCFSGAAYFEPVVGLTLIEPMPAENTIAPRDLDELLTLAQAQIAAIRGSYPMATGGTLAVAELHRSSISTMLIPDFDVAARSETMMQKVRQTV